MHQPDVVARERSAGNAAFASSISASDFFAGYTGIAWLRERARLTRADERDAAPRHEREHPALRSGRRERDVARRLRRQRRS